MNGSLSSMLRCCPANGPFSPSSSTSRAERKLPKMAQLIAALEPLAAPTPTHSQLLVLRANAKHEPLCLLFHRQQRPAPAQLFVQDDDVWDFQTSSSWTNNPLIALAPTPTTTTPRSPLSQRNPILSVGRLAGDDLQTLGRQMHMFRSAGGTDVGRRGRKERRDWR